MLNILILIKMVLGIQLIGIMFGIFMIYLTFLNYKQNKFNGKEWIVWCILWITFLVVILLPSILNPFLEALHLYRAMDLYISLGFLFFILIIFNTHSSLRKVQQQVEIIVMELATYKTSKKRKRR